MLNKKKLEALESVLHVSLTTNGLVDAKPSDKKVGAFAFKMKDGRTFNFAFEHFKVLEGFEMDGSYHMAFRFTDLNIDYVNEENDALPKSWADVFEGELEEVSYEVLDELGMDVRCEIVFISLIDKNGEWHSVSLEKLEKYNGQKTGMTN